MNIYFHIDELKRDAVVASALKKKFAKKGHNLVYGNRVSNRLLKYFHRAFDVVVVPRPHFFYDNWGDEWLSWDAKVMTLSTESLGIICRDHHVMARTLLEKEYFQNKKHYAERIDAFCFWGSRQLQSVKDYAPEIAPKCHVVGHPRHDQTCAQAAPSEVKRKIGITTRAVILNDYFGRSALTAFETLFDDHFQYEYINKSTGEKLKSTRPGAQPLNAIISQAIEAECILRVIHALNEAGYEVTLRPHPKDDIRVWRWLLQRCRLQVDVPDTDMPISKWLEDVKYIIGAPSTSFYDALMLGVTPISIDKLNPRREECVDELWEDNNHLMPFVFRPGSIEALVEIVERGDSLCNDENVLSVLEKEANFPACKHSLETFVDVCLNTVDQSKAGSESLLAFESVRTVFNKAWKFKNLIVRRGENSAMFVMDSKAKRFIDNLTTAD